MSGVLVVTNACAFYTAHAAAGARHPAFPTPSVFLGERFFSDSGASRREARTCVCSWGKDEGMRAPDAAQRHKRVYARLRRAMSCGVVRC